MKTLIILNDPAYGTERSYNGFRLARNLAGKDADQVRLFLMGDAVTCAIAGQKTPRRLIQPGEDAPGHRLQGS